MQTKPLRIEGATPAPRKPPQIFAMPYDCTPHSLLCARLTPHSVFPSLPIALFNVADTAQVAVSNGADMAQIVLSN